MSLWSINTLAKWEFVIPLKKESEKVFWSCEEFGCYPVRNFQMSLPIMEIWDFWKKVEEACWKYQRQVVVWRIIWDTDFILLQETPTNWKSKWCSVYLLFWLKCEFWKTVVFQKSWFSVSFLSSQRIISKNMPWNGWKRWSEGNTYF